jgi:ArsR family transcriptional regulator, arsenate/arsenite/antimonite-responsive transcriptional repressor
VREFLNIAKALSDPARVRSLLALRGGELCLCHFIALLELSPSTVSKHLDLLYQAGLVQRRKDGRWAYFCLSGREAGPTVRAVLRWVLHSLDDDAIATRDVKRLRALRCCDPKELAACYKS